MIIIRPRILISASIISLALLLASATPIPSLDVLSGGNGNSLVMRDSAIFSKPQELFPRYTDVRKRLMSLMNQMQETPSSEKGMVTILNEVATLIPELPTIDTGIRSKVFAAIADVKFFVSAFKSERQEAIKDIEACEAAALARGIDRIFNPQLTSIVTLMKEMEAGFKDRDYNKVTNSLNRLVPAVANLSLTEQRTIKKELEDAYGAADAKITASWSRDRQESAQGFLKKWEQLNSLLNVPKETKSTEKV